MNKLTIPRRSYEGYVWYSNAQTPKVLKGEVFSVEQQEGVNPFVIEALLFCKEENISLSIRHTGHYIISEHNLSMLGESSEIVEKEYLPHRLDGVEKLKFNQYWKEENVINNDMKTLKLQATLFTGFILKKD